MNEKKTSGSNINAGEGTGVISGSTATGDAPGGNLPVAAPTDAAPGEPQAGNLGAPDTAGTQNAGAAAGQTKESAGYALEITRKGHTHGGVEYKKGQTIMLDMAEYRWALENKVGKPGNAENVGFEVDSKGMVLSPENEKAIEELEAEASK